MTLETAFCLLAVNRLQLHPCGTLLVCYVPQWRDAKKKDSSDRLLKYHPQLLAMEIHILACHTLPNQTVPLSGKWGLTLTSCYVNQQVLNEALCSV